MTDRNSDDDWVETLTKLAASVGFNPVRVRWKLTRLRQSWSRTERLAEQKVQHVKYEHKVCPSCGRVNDRYAVRCVGCSQPMSSRAWQVFERIGVSMPDLVSVSSLLGLAMLGVYAYLMVRNPGQGYSGWRPEVLVRHGANWAPATFDGQWWRLGTYVFNHIGLWHLGFNLLALAQTGPLVEKAFGRGRMLFFFMLTGAAGGLGSLLWTPGGFSAGASGAIMGLTGVGLGWGHRDGSASGIAVRNQMIKWALYTMAFGFIVNMSARMGFRVDNAAHGAGLVLGALLGYLTPPAWVRPKTSIRPFSLLLGLAGAVAAIGAVYLTIVPPRAAYKWVDATTRVGSIAIGYMVIDQACAARDAGDRAKGVKKLAELQRFGLKLSGEGQAEDLDGACEHARAVRVMCALEPPTPPHLLEPSRPEDEELEDDSDEADRQRICASVRMAESWKAKGY